MSDQSFPPVRLETVKSQIAELRNGQQLRDHLQSRVQFAIFRILQYEQITPQHRQALGQQTVIISKILQCMDSPLGQNPTVFDNLIRTPGISYFKKHINQLKNLPKWEPDWVDVLFAVGWRLESFGLPQLCLFTDDSLCSLFRLLLGRPNLSMDATRKARQRLGFSRQVTPIIKDVVDRKGMLEFNREHQARVDKKGR